MMVHETIGEYIERITKEPFFAKTGPFDSDLFERAQHAIIESLYRLDALPRTDALWHNTNNQATVYKLSVFSRKLLTENADDEQALWCRAAIELYPCRTSFGIGAWKEMYRLRRLSLQWPIYAAYYVQASSGARTVHLLGQLLQDLDLCDEAKVFKAQLHEAPPSLIRFLDGALSFCEDSNAE